MSEEPAARLPPESTEADPKVDVEQAAPSQEQSVGAAANVGAVALASTKLKKLTAHAQTDAMASEMLADLTAPATEKLTEESRDKKLPDILALIQNEEKDEKETMQEAARP